ncbi:MAG: hypothetical protein U0934_12855 [Pseudotabrizicola sp.]|uniref:hypothetical protein n=1 Tax=Pseudotabrizicola sp. TaxID=2939647 RepID=UPI00272F95B9|nr:hypothetical protein [Pseudotabrizicola sp.]MDP2079827.1 hypothetical protein [Pseudotabrizicola sp.]MDZ7574828.1 hypothetical protein [Pseudotabrizicola sp.]
MSDAYNSTTTTPGSAPGTAPGYSNPGNQPYAGATHTSHVRETQTSTNWFAWMLGGAVVAVGIAALVYSGSDAPPAQPAGSNNVTIEAPATAPAAEAPVTPQPDAVVPVAPEAPAVADPVAPAPDAAAPAPAGN